jgi:serine acetyltransferase
VRENCVLGDNVTLENGAIVGADGFGFAKNEAGQWEKIPQSGPVRLGNRVDVQANACIDRATVGATEIGDGTKVDNLVQVGHGSRVGENTLLCAQTGLAGSSVVGNNVILAGQTGIAGHCAVGDGVILTAQSAVSHDVPQGKTISGSPGSTTESGCAPSPSFSACRSCSSASTAWRRESRPMPRRTKRGAVNEESDRESWPGFGRNRAAGADAGGRVPLLSRGNHGRKPHRSADSTARGRLPKRQLRSRQPGRRRSLPLSHPVAGQRPHQGAAGDPLLQ